MLGCSPERLSDGERRVALQGTTERVIVATQAELSRRASQLASSLDELEQEPTSEALDAARDAYRAVRAPLEEARAFELGPATELHSFVALDQAPIDSDKIDAELASDAELTLDSVGNLGANKRGLHALEYLLFPVDSQGVADALLADDVAGERRRRLASLTAQLVESAADDLVRAWSPEGDDYARRFSQPGGADSVAPGVQSGLDALLNQTLVASEEIATVKLGRPLGVDSGGEPLPELEESGLAELSLSDMLSELHGVRNVYLGDRDAESSPSLSSLVHAKSPAADVHVRAALDEAEATVRAVPEPFARALEQSPKSVRAAYDAVKALKRVLATEALGALGASLQFSDNDGD